MNMFQRFLGNTGNKKVRSSPFIDYAIFDDPKRYFEALPNGKETAWFLESPGIQHLKLLLGMAFLNDKKVAIIVPDQESEAIAQKFAEQLKEDITQLVKISNTNNLKIANLSDILNEWRHESGILFENIAHLNSIKFGSLNGLEVTTTLIKLFPRTAFHPYPWIDTKHFEWTYDEYRNLYEILVERNNKLNPIVHQKLQRLFRINTATWSKLPSASIKSTLDHHLQELGVLINQLDLLLHTSKPTWYSTLKTKEAIWLSTDSPLGRIKRMTIHGMQEAGLPIESLLEWKKAINGWQSNFEKSALLITTSGFQAISLGDLETEIKNLYQELSLIKEWQDAIKETTDIYVANEELPLGIKLLLEAGVTVPVDHKSDVFTYWYLYHWLEHHVSSQQWKALYFSPERTLITERLNTALFHQLSHLNRGTSASEPDIIIDYKIRQFSNKETIPPEYLKIYWKNDANLSELEARFDFVLRHIPPIPMEYAHMVQLFADAEPSIFQALPFYTPSGTIFWEGKPTNPIIQENPMSMQSWQVNTLK
jgi:hypothetical protein